MAGQFAVEVFLRRQKFVAAFLQKIFDLGFEDFALSRTLYQAETLFDYVQLRGIKFLRLDQDFFTHAYFSEIMQQTGIADLAHLVAGEADAGVKTALVLV